VQIIRSYIVIFTASRTLVYNKQRSQSSYSFYEAVHLRVMLSILNRSCNNNSPADYSLVEDIATKAKAVLSNLRNRGGFSSEMIRVACHSD
jgi:hypothetical protein